VRAVCRVVSDSLEGKKVGRILRPEESYHSWSMNLGSHGVLSSGRFYLGADKAREQLKKRVGERLAL